MISAERSDHWHSGKFLAGFVSETEAVQAMANGVEHATSIESIRKTWADSAQRVRTRSPTSLAVDLLGFPNDTSSELETALDKVKKRLSGDPQLSGNPWSFNLVGIEGLVSIQKQVNVTMANQLADAVTDHDDLMGATKIALLTELHSSPIAVLQDAQGVIISSPDLNLSLMGAGVIEGQNDLGDKIKSATLSFGCLQSYVRIVHFGGRYFVRDGYHRIYALKQKGFTHVPAIVIESTNPAEVIPPGNLFPLPTVLSDNPPLFSDFDDNAVDVKIPKLNKVIRVRFEPFIVPS